VKAALLHPKRLALLAYLCASPLLQLVRRDTLVGLLWPEQDEAHACGALRQELYQLRRALGAGVLRGDRADAVGIDTQRLWCDVCAFESALDSGRRLEALELWHGEFLPGLHVKGEGFQRWLDQERDRLRRRAADAARLLAAEAEQSDDGPAAIRWARRLTALAPYDETAWQHLIAQLDRQGDRAGALRAYDDLVAWLASEIGVEPSPETRLIVEQVRDRREAFSRGARSLSWAPAPEIERRAGFAARPVIGLLPVQNRTGDPTLDALAGRVTDRLAQGLAGAMFVDVAPIGEEAHTTAVVSATLYRQGEWVEVVPSLAEPGENGRLVEMPRAVQLSPDAPRKSSTPWWHT
jgi:DNA-binding SARP family transcriptional activator